MYPGRSGQCLKSLRYLALCRGIEDFELAQMVKAAVSDGDAVPEKALHCVLREYDVAQWDFCNYFVRDAYMSLASEDYTMAWSIMVDALLHSQKE